MEVSVRFLFFSLALLLLARLEATEDLPLPVYSPDLATKAELNDPVAQFEIGRCFALGVGVPKDEVLARQWWARSAGNGNLEALRLLRVEHKNLWLKSSGYAVPLVGTSAEFSALKDKAEEGDPDSLYRLGLMYAVGFPQIPELPKVEVDEPKGREFMHEAAEAGSVPAQLWLGNFYAGKAQGQKDSPYQSKAWGYLIQAAEAGDPQGQLLVACMLGKGEGCDRDPAQAFSWLKKSAEQGNSSAMRMLAMCYLIGEGVQISEADASHWFQRYYKTTSDSSVKARQRMVNLEAQQKEKKSP